MTTLKLSSMALDKADLTGLTEQAQLMESPKIASGDLSGLTEQAQPRETRHCYCHCTESEQERITCLLLPAVSHSQHSQHALPFCQVLTNHEVNLVAMCSHTASTQVIKQCNRMQCVTVQTTQTNQDSPQAVSQHICQHYAHHDIQHPSDSLPTS